MNVVEAGLRRIADDLQRRGHSWALVGGFVIASRAEPRFTRDVDVVVAVANDSEAEALVHSLFNAGYGLLASIEHDVTGRLAAVRLGLDDAGAGGCRRRVVRELRYRRGSTS